MLVIGDCISSTGLGCGHWRELVYAWRHGWPEVLTGLALALVFTVAGTRYRPLLAFGVGSGIAVIVGFGVYYISL
jgi:hypothetical protein